MKPYSTTTVTATLITIAVHFVSTGIKQAIAGLYANAGTIAIITVEDGISHAMYAIVKSFVSLKSVTHELAMDVAWKHATLGCI